LSDNPAALALLGIYNPLYIQYKAGTEAIVSENAQLIETEENDWKEEYELLTERKLVFCQQ
jgi:hypothetical protein